MPRWWKPKSWSPKNSGVPLNRLAFQLLSQLTHEQPTGNVFFSFFSILLCLLMVWDGASGETREEITRLLALSEEDPEWRAGPWARLKSVMSIRDPNLELAIANSLWCADHVQIQQHFVAQVAEKYGAEVVPLSFQNAGAIDRINSWAAEKTKGKINELISTLDPLTLLMALNAVYFKGAWKEPFRKDETKMEPFYSARGGTVQVPMMHQYDAYPYHEEKSFQEVRLSYGEGRVGMYVFLPSKGLSLAEFLQAATPADWQRRLRWLPEKEGNLALPRLKLEHRIELAPILPKLGMRKAFGDSAQFDHIAHPPPPILLNAVMHQAVVDVNEKGTEAAAVTGAVMPMAAARKRPKPFTMIVDRPFLFLIHDNPSGMSLFVGVVNNL